MNQAVKAIELKADFNALAKDLFSTPLGNRNPTTELPIYYITFDTKHNPRLVSLSAFQFNQANNGDKHSLHLLVDSNNEMRCLFALAKNDSKITQRAGMFLLRTLAESPTLSTWTKDKEDISHQYNKDTLQQHTTGKTVVLSPT